MGNGDRCRAVSFSCVGAHFMRPASRVDRVAVREHGRGQVVGVCNAPYAPHDKPSSTMKQPCDRWENRRMARDKRWREFEDSTAIRRIARQTGGPAAITAGAAPRR